MLGWILLGVAQLTAPPAALDFWVGDWTCEVRSKGKDGKWHGRPASNRITKILGGKVFHEEFSMPGYAGESWTPFDSKSRTWKQTWVDDQGVYVALEGVPEKGLIVLKTLPPAGTPRTFTRMVFRDVAKDSLLWTFEKTLDSGKSWTRTIEVAYRRKPG